MSDLRNIATFQSPRFQPPGNGLVAADDALVSWVVDRLRRTTDFQVLDAEAEDWGTFVRVKQGRAEYQLNLAVDEQVPPGWMLEVQDPPRLLRSLLARQNPDVHGQLIEAVHSVLCSDPGVGQVQWHRGSAFGRGDRSTGAPVPDRPAAL